MGHRTKSLWEGKSHAFWGHLSLVLFLYITLRQICQFPSRNRNPSSQQWGQIQTERPRLRKLLMLKLAPVTKLLLQSWRRQSLRFQAWVSP